MAESKLITHLKRSWDEEKLRNLPHNPRLQTDADYFQELRDDNYRLNMNVMVLSALLLLIMILTLAAMCYKLIKGSKRRNARRANFERQRRNWPGRGGKVLFGGF